METRRRALSYLILLFVIFRRVCLANDVRDSIRFASVFEGGENVVIVDSIQVNQPFLRPQDFANDSNTNSATQNDSTPFRFKIQCVGHSRISCGRILSVMKRVGERIGQELHIHRTIHVLVDYYSFRNTRDPDSNVGYASPTAADAFPARPINSHDALYYVYPQALLKQLRVVNSEHYDASLLHEFDVHIRFNSDQKLWIREHKRPIEPDETDLEVVACHELAHGLGFISSITNHSPILPHRSRSYAVFHHQGNFTHWIPTPFIFDRFLEFRDNAIPVLNSLATPFARSKIKSEERFASSHHHDQDFLTDLEKNEKMYIRSCSLHDRMARKHCAVQFHAKDIPQARRVCLSTLPGEFLAGSSISHIGYAQEKHATFPDFLMMPVVEGMQGQTLDALLEKHSDDGTILGPRTLAILTALGWPTNLNPSPKPVEIDPSAIKRDIFSLSPDASTFPAKKETSAARGESYVVTSLQFILAMFIFKLIDH